MVDRGIGPGRAWSPLELRHALRVIRRTPGPALVAALTMALGIAATTLLFTITWNVLMKPLPWADADRLIRPEETRQGAPRNFPRIMTNSTYLAWRETPSTIESIAAYSAGTVTLTGAGDPQRIRVTSATASLFSTLRGIPVRGSFFTAADETGARVAVLSHALWQRQFGGREDILDRTIALDGEDHRIIGVLSPDFAFPDRETQAWVPLEVASPVVPGGSRIQTFNVVARLKPGMTASQAAQEATARGRSAPDIGMAVMAMFGSKGPVSVTARPLLEAMTADVRDALIILLAAVGLLLASATANIASVQLARSTARRREMAIRAAIGASTGRLARQALIESLVVGLAGGAGGLGLALLLQRMLPSVLPEDFPRIADIAIDFRVVIFAFGVSLLASVAFGLVPALQARRINLVDALVEDASASGSGAGRSRTARTRALIMAGQVAVACVLLVGASLLVQTFVAMLRQDRGYDPSNVLTAKLASPEGLFTPERRAALTTTTLERLRELPGVRAAAFTSVLPLGRGESMMTFRLPPREGQSDAVQVHTGVRTVSQGYFEAMGISLVSGRTFDDRDTARSMPVFIVNRAFADRYLPGRAAGERLVLTLYARDEWEVAGVVENVTMKSSLADPALPEIFFVYTQRPGGLASEPTFVVRTDGNPMAVAESLRQIVRSEDPSAALESVMTMEQRVRGSLARPRLYATVLAGFAGFALLIAGVGLFGILSYGVTQRSKELGVRAALGAQPRDIVGLVLKEGIVITMAGAVLGLAAAVVLTRWLSTFLYGVTTRDPLTFVAVPALLLVIAAIAAFVPARRAARIDPLRVMRMGG